MPSVSSWWAIEKPVLRNYSRFQLRNLFTESVHPSAVGHGIVALLLAHLLALAGAPLKPAGDGADADAHASAATLPLCSAANRTRTTLQPLLAAQLRWNDLWAKSTPPQAHCVPGSELRPWVFGGDCNYSEDRDRGQRYANPGWMPSAPNSSIHLCPPNAAGQQVRFGPVRGTAGTWKLAFMQSYTSDMGSVEASCSGRCTCGSVLLHGWNTPYLDKRSNLTAPIRASFVVPATVHVLYGAGLGLPRSGQCDCMLSLRLVDPARGIAPYH